MDAIRYTIIIPHYNIPKLLVRLIDTIPELDDIQVIIVDDHSPGADSYTQEYPQLSRKNVEFYCSSENKGGGHARNLGLKFAKGKWLVFADADDLFVPDILDIFNKYYNSEEDIVFFRIKSVYSDNINLKANRHFFRDAQYEMFLRTNDEMILRYKTVEAWAKIFKREMIEKYDICFDETIVANDYFFSIKCGFFARNIKIASEVMYILTEREGSVSSNGWTSSPEKLLIRLNVAKKVQIFLRSHAIDLTPMPIRGMMVLLLKTQPYRFLIEILKLPFEGISVIKLLWQMWILRSKK